MTKMKKTSEMVPKSLGGKLIRFVVIFVLCLGLFFLIVTIANLSQLSKMVEQEGEKQTDLVQEKSMESISELTKESLYETVAWAADMTDDEFFIMQHDLLNLREQVEDVLRDPEKYETVTVEPPKTENAGKYVLQLLCPGSYEEISPETMESMGKLANLSSMMEEMVRGNADYTVDIYIATPDGVCIAMDNRSDGKYDETGVIRPYDATTRPWYQKALGKDEVVFIPAHSHFYNFNEVIYSVPVYVDGTLVAVLEGSARVDGLEENLAERNIGKSGFSILVADGGQLVCSPRTDGELKMRDDVSEDIRPEINAGLAEAINKGLAGEHDVTVTEVDGEYYYMAYDWLETIGWTQLAFVSAEELLAPAQGLAEDMDNATQDMLTNLRIRFRYSIVFLMILLAGIAAFVIVAISALAKRRVAPINRMTEKVRALTEKDMTFEMEPIYETGDEIETLARSFEQQSKELKEYVEENIRISAEKERIGAELNVAKKIQKDMLPSIFPVFPDRKEFELYASMNPAKEVGGDFYDMFLIDEDHLCMVVGDVSGKGVPAAMFMVISKTMLKNRAQAGGKPSEILFDVNNSLCEGNNEKMFVTVWLGILTISTGELVAANAGHEYPAVRRVDGVYELYEDDHGLVLGGMEDMTYLDSELVLKKGDTLFIYTDGLPEATNGEGVRLEEKRMLEALNAHKEETGEGLLRSISEEVNRFVGDAPQFDDLTMLVLKYVG